VTESFAIPAGVCPNTGPNAPPVLLITAPATGSSYAQGIAASFTGTATDEDGNLSNSIGWTSSLQGALGTGATVTRSDLIQGTHVITAAVTDSAALTASATTTVTVVPPISLTTRPFKVGKINWVDLTWSPIPGANVDIYGDGLVVATTVNDGFHSHSMGRLGKGTYRFRVCQAGSKTVCSPYVPATF
jgi:hypothetical protein